VVHALADVLTNADCGMVHQGSAESAAFFKTTTKKREADGVPRVVADVDTAATELPLMSRS
jgi:hypothetical protein